jgi:methyl-accepting chemotaxis protein
MLTNLGSHLKVGTRVAIGFASVLVLLGIVAGIGYLGFTGNAGSTQRLGIIARAYEHVSTVESAFAQMRRAVLLYAQSGSDEAKEEVRKYQRIIVEQSQAALKIMPFEEKREQMRGILATFAQYTDGFEQIVKAKGEQAQLDATMRPAGARMQQLLSDMMQSSLMTDDMSIAAHAGMTQELLLAARLNINIYFANPVPAVAKTAKDNLEKLPQSIKDLHDSIESSSEKDRAKELMKLAAMYVPGTIKTLAITDERNRIVNDMGVKLGARMDEQIRALTAAQMQALDATREDALANIDRSLNLSVGLAAVALVIGLALAFIIGQGISKPLTKISAVLAELADGRKDVDIPYAERKDEIGDNARAARTFKENLLRVEKMENEQAVAMEMMAQEFEAAVGGIVKAAVAGDFSQRVDLKGKTGMVLNVGTAINSLCENVAKALDDLLAMLNALGGGDLTQRITTQYSGNFAVLADNANKTAERIGATIAEIKASTREVTSASAEISTSTTDLSQRTEAQAASLEQTSASMEEIAVTVRKNAENAHAANASAGSAQSTADRGGNVVADAVKAMAKIEESSRQISDIIGVIDEIARQTNLLALNAAVEAARAGEAGRGFAVVASEVRSLAQRSSQAARDIKELITNSNTEVKGGVALVNKAGEALTEIVASIKGVASIVSDIATASAEQASGIDQVNKALTQMDEMTQQNSALVEENAATARTLEDQARAMQERVAFFQLAAGDDVAPAPSSRPAAAKPAPHRPARGPALRIATRRD